MNLTKTGLFVPYLAAQMTWYLARLHTNMFCIYLPDFVLLTSGNLRHHGNEHLQKAFDILLDITRPPTVFILPEEM